MPFSSGLLEIVIANGSNELIFCSMTSDKTTVTERGGGVGLNVGIGGAEVNGSVKYVHESVNKNGYTSIVPGSIFKFNPAGKPIYLTILSQTDKFICVNLEVNKSSNYIVSKNNHLKQAAKGQTWIEENGRDHQLVKAKDNVSSTDSEKCANHSNNPAEMFYKLGIGSNQGHRSVQNLHSSIITVSISNGSPNAIHCRVSKEKSKQRNSLKASCLADGHTTIDSMNSLPFSSSENLVYVTIITDSGKQMCVNHEISKSSNFIISWNLQLKTAKTGQLWVDSTGTDHARPYRIDKIDNRKLDEIVRKSRKPLPKLKVDPGRNKKLRERKNAGKMRNCELFRNGNIMLSEQGILKHASTEKQLVDITGKDHTIKRSIQTHKRNVVIANGSGYTVHCKFVKEDNSRQSSNGVGGCGFVESKRLLGYISLRSGCHINFPAKEMYIMTIRSASSRILCQNVKIDEDGEQLIISKRNKLHWAKNGKLWIDKEGKNHKIQWY